MSGPLVVPDRQRIEVGLTRLHKLAKLLDDQFEIPGLRYKIGLDPIIGLIPGVGDWITWGASVYIFWQAVRLGAPLGLLAQMGANVAIDLVVGYAPGLGDVFDAVFKANKRNIELLMRHFGGNIPKDGSQRVIVPADAPIIVGQRSKLVRYGVVTLLLLGLLGLVVLPWVIIAWWLTTQP